MKRVTIPDTDLNVSNICYGATYSEFEDAAKYHECLDSFIYLGGNFIDTANIYGKWLEHGKNSNEIMLGNWMRQKGNRSSIVVASKAAHPDLADMSVPRMSFEEITSDLEESLAALQTDYLDILWLHRDAENIPVETIVDMLARICETGKIRYFGCSNWQPARIEKALEYSRKKGMRGFIANQPQWSLAKANQQKNDDPTMVRMDAAGMSLHERTGLAAIPYSSQANGFFTKYNAGSVSEWLLTKYMNDDNMRTYKNIKKLSAETGYTCTEISLSYLMSYNFLTIPIIGSKTPEQINDSVSAGDIRLSRDQMELLRS